MRHFPLLYVPMLIAGSLAAQTGASPTEQVRQTEIAFAKTMADRDFAGFASFLADDAVFVSATRVLRGAKEVTAGWKAYYDGSQAPFSWEPDQVVVLDSGTLALSSGPVRDPSGKRIGTFNSVWRRDAGGRWKIVLDKGCPPCDCGAR